MYMSDHLKLIIIIIIASARTYISDYIIMYSHMHVFVHYCMVISKY